MWSWWVIISWEDLTDEDEDKDKDEDEDGNWDVDEDEDPWLIKYKLERNTLLWIVCLINHTSCSTTVLQITHNGDTQITNVSKITMCVKSYTMCSRVRRFCRSWKINGEGDTDNTNRAIQGNLVMQVTQPGGQVCNLCKWRYLVANIRTNASDLVETKMM